MSTLCGVVGITPDCNVKLLSVGHRFDSGRRDFFPPLSLEETDVGCFLLGMAAGPEAGIYYCRRAGAVCCTHRLCSYLSRGSILESKATMIEVDRNNPSYSMSKDR